MSPVTTFYLFTRKNKGVFPPRKKGFLIVSILNMKRNLKKVVTGDLTPKRWKGRDK